MLNKILLTIITALAFSFASHGQTYKLSNFVETVPPKSGSAEWYKLNHSQLEFEVRNSGNSLEIRKAQTNAKCELKIKNGILTGIDNGEWGGQLIFTSVNKANKPKEIKSGNIKFVFELNNKTYFIEGLAHLSISEGALYELDIAGDEFSYKKIMDFEDAPEAYTLFNNKILIAAHSSFYVVQDFKKDQVIKDAFWNNLYPNSIAALDENNIYLGIRSGIVKLNLGTKAIKFFKFEK